MSLKDDKKTVLIVDGQGGGMGSELVKRLVGVLPESHKIMCVGTNVLATSAMLKAGCPQGATGENAAAYQASKADIIVGPIGILLANGILGEVSPLMATAISGSSAAKVLIPSSSCGIYVAGTENRRLEEYIGLAVGRVLEIINS